MFTWSGLFGPPPAVLTVVGMAKNSGKTVTMNYLQRLLQEDGRVLGLLSVGVDGESFDALTGLPKPAVVVRPGTLVATVEKALDGSGRWEVLADTGIHTPLGRVAILRAGAENRVVLAGPSKNEDVKAVLAALAGLGAGCALVDGAFDRQSAADPLVSEQVVLASGATLSRDINRLVAMTKCRAEQLTLPACSAEYRGLAGRCRAKAALLAGGELRELEAPTALLSGGEWQALLGAGCEAVFLRGAAGAGLAEALLAAARPPTVIVEDGGKIFIEPAVWERLRRRGVRFAAARPIRLLAVTVNPVLPGGGGLDPDELLAAMGQALAPLPVLDVVRERRYEG